MALTLELFTSPGFRTAQTLMEQVHKQRITEYILETADVKSYQSATQHPFLQAARSGTLSGDLLSLWLSQDRTYAAHAYPKFIGTLISKIPFSSHHGIGSAEEAKNQRILALLTYALQNVVREAQFFLETAEKYDFNLEGWKKRAATISYCSEMERNAKWGSLEEGLVFLWAMEKLYLDSWSFVAEGLSAQANNQSSVSQAVREFAKNWTNEEFVKFVEDLRLIADDTNIRPDSELWWRTKEVWDKIVELEIKFWPQDGEEVQGRIGQ